MTRTRLGLLGLCAMVFGLMAFSASAAQAEVGAKWLFAEKEPNSGLIPFLEAEVGLETDTTAVLHTKIAGVSVLYLCPIIEALNVILKANGSIGEGASIDFLNCVTHLNGVLSKVCEPVGGVIKTNKGHGLIILHKLASGTVDDLLKILPDDVINGKGEKVKSETFATIEMGEECSIGTKVPVIGSATLKDCEGLFLKHLVKHLIEVGTWGVELTELWAISKTEEHKATI